MLLCEKGGSTEDGVRLLSSFGHGRRGSAHGKAWKHVEEE